MKNTTNSNSTKNLNNQGGKIMKNRLTENLNKEAEVAAAKAVKDQAKEIEKANQELINSITPNTIAETCKDVAAGEYYAVANAEGAMEGIAGNGIVKHFVVNGKQCLAWGTTEEEVTADEDYVRLMLARTDIQVPQVMGLYYSGRYMLKVVDLCGYPVSTVGHTEEERLEDEGKARVCFAKLRKTGLGDVRVAEELNEAGYKAIEFEKDGHRYMYIPALKDARDFDFNEVANIKDITDKLSDTTAIEILKSRIVTPQYEEDDYEDDDIDYDSCYNDDLDYYPNDDPDVCENCPYYDDCDDYGAYND